MIAFLPSTDIWDKANLQVTAVMSTLEALSKQVSELSKKHDILNKKVDLNQEYCDGKFLDAEREDVIGWDSVRPLQLSIIFVSIQRKGNFPNFFF